jgi:hypothetical protein
MTAAAEATAIESEMPRFNKALVKGPLPVQQGRYGILDCTECGKRADGDLYLGLCLFCTVMSMRAESES